MKENQRGGYFLENQNLVNDSELSFIQNADMIYVHKGMPTIYFVMLAGRVIRDNLSGKFSIIDVFSDFRLTPEVPQFFYIFARIKKIKGGGQKEVIVRIYPPNSGTPVGESKLSGNLADGDLDIAAAFATTFKVAGKHKIKVFYDGTEVEGGGDNLFFEVKNP